MRRKQHLQPHARQQTQTHALDQGPRNTHTSAAPDAASRLPAAADTATAHDVPPVAPETPFPLLLTPTEAARALHINRSTLYPLLMRGEIPSIRIGRARRIPREGLMRWIERQVNEQRSQDDWNV